MTRVDANEAAAPATRAAEKVRLLIAMRISPCRIVHRSCRSDGSDRTSPRIARAPVFELEVTEFELQHQTFEERRPFCHRRLETVEISVGCDDHWQLAEHPIPTSEPLRARRRKPDGLSMFESVDEQINFDQIVTATDVLPLDRSPLFIRASLHIVCV